MAKKEVDGEGLNIPNRIKALPVKRPGPIVAAVIVVLLAAMLIQGLITNPRLDWPTVWKYLFNENVLEGIRYTLELTVISMVVAIILSVILAIMRKSINPVLRGVSWFFIWFFRGTPVYTQLIFWGLFAVLIPKISLGIPFTSVEFWSIDSNVVVTAFNAAWIGLALNEAAYLSEIVRAGLEAVDPGQTEAAAPGQPKPGMTVIRFHNSHLVYALTWYGLAAMVVGKDWRVKTLTAPEFAQTPEYQWLAANCARYVGAEVVFADVDPDSGLMTPETLAQALERAAGRRVKAVLPVHLRGDVCDLPALKALADEGKIERDKVAAALVKYNLDPSKPNPMSV